MQVPALLNGYSSISACVRSMFDDSRMVCSVFGALARMENSDSPIDSLNSSLAANPISYCGCFTIECVGVVVEDRSTLIEPCNHDVIGNRESVENTRLENGSGRDARHTKHCIGNACVLLVEKRSTAETHNYAKPKGARPQIISSFLR